MVISSVILERAKKSPSIRATSLLFLSQTVLQNREKEKETLALKQHK